MILNLSQGAIVVLYSISCMVFVVYITNVRILFMVGMMDVEWHGCIAVMSLLSNCIASSK